MRARDHLPDGPEAFLDSTRVSRFVSSARADENLRLQVLSVLRTHSANGVETPAAIFALFIAAAGSYISTLIAMSDFGAAIALAVVAPSLLGVARFAAVAAALHVRRLTALAWLAAYEEALRVDEGRRSRAASSWFRRLLPSDARSHRS